MPGQSITFDFISRGAPALSGDFKRTGDNAAAAARGAKVLQDVIKSLGDKENRTAADSATLAKALKLTGDAEDRAAAKALAADIAIRRLDDAMQDSSKSADSAKGGLAGLAGEVTGFGAAAGAASSKGTLFSRALAGVNLASGVLEPAMAGVVVAAGGAAAAFASAGLGVAAFSTVAKAVLSSASDAAKKYTAAQQKLNSATDSKQRVAALAGEKAALAGLDASQRQVVFSIIGAQNAWQGFTRTATPGVAKVLAGAVRLLPEAFGLLRPFLAPVESALTGVIGELKAGVGPGSQFAGVMGDFAAHSGKDLTLILQTAGHLFLGVLGAVHAFLPEGGSLLTWADQASAKFAKWGETLSSHTGFQSLMATFRTETPQAMAILKNLGVVLVNVGKSMFGLSTFSNSKLLLAALTPLSGILASLSRNQGLTRIVLYLLAATTAARKLGPAFTGIKAAVAFFPAAGAAIAKFAGSEAIAAAGGDAMTVSQTIAAAATRAWGLAMDALPWVALAAAVIAVAVLIIKYHTQIWHFMIRVWNDILQIISGVWGWIKKNWPLLLAILTGPVGLATLEIVRHWVEIEKAFDTTLGAIKSAWGTVWGALRTAFRVFVVDGVLGPLGLIVDGAARAFGWIPGLGSRLKGAAKAFDQFKANVNASLGGINGRTVNVSVAMTSATNPYPGGISGRAAAGMYVASGRPGVDDQLILAQRGEVIVPTGMVRAGDVDHLRGRIPGFAGGGQVGVNVTTTTPAAAAVESALMSSVVKLAKAFAATLGGNGQAIADYAMTWLGKVPYVWGGTSVPGGADCSGFTQAILAHFGIHAPRTSEAQGAWVSRSGPVPGALAFYHSPPGGPDPGHVAIVRSAQQAISQGGGMGPTLMPLHALPLLWTGIPPGGFPGGAGGGPAGTGQMSGQAIAALWTSLGGPAFAASNMAAIANAESADRPGAVQTGQPPGLTGWGLYQITPTSGITQNGRYGNLLNASNNTRAAIYLFSQSGYSPWAADPVGASLGQAPIPRRLAAGGLVAGYAAGTAGAAPGWAVVRFGGGEQVIPGFASGGQVARQGAAYLKAWQARHGGGFGAAWGPVPVNPQIDAMTTAQHQASVLAGASGLTAAQHRHWAAVAADRKKRVAALTRERDTGRDWRAALAAGDTRLASQIRAAGTAPSLRADAAAWKAQLAWQKWTIGNISAMLGLSAAQVAAAQKAGTLGPGGAALPTVTHTYGGDIANTTGAFLASVAAPFGAARGGLVMDSGGWLKPGWNPPVYNGTGRPEPVGAARGGTTVRFEVASSGNGFDAFMLAWMKKHVKVKGGGSVQVAFGTH